MVYGKSGNTFCSIVYLTSKDSKKSSPVICSVIKHAGKRIEHGRSVEETRDVHCSQRLGVTPETLNKTSSTIAIFSKFVLLHL